MRCGAQVVSLKNRGDADINTCRWLTSRRHSLYNDEDHFSPDICLVLPDRRDEFVDINPIRHVLQDFLENGSFRKDINPIRHDVLQQFLENKCLRKKMKAKSGVRSWRFHRSSTRLPVSERVARATLWGVFRLDAGV